MFVFLNQIAGFESGVVDENQTSSESNLGSCRAGRQTRETAIIATQFHRGSGMSFELDSNQNKKSAFVIINYIVLSVVLVFSCIVMNSRGGPVSKGWLFARLQVPETSLQLSGRPFTSTCRGYSCLFSCGSSDN